MKTYFISGGRTGIGLEYVRQRSSQAENTVIGTIRSLFKGANLGNLESIINSPDTKTQIHLVKSDLSSADSISSLGSRLPSELEGKTNVVIQNTAILLPVCQNESSLKITPKSLQDHLTTT
jgi:short-subunit dehydrogenase involved in D-alanine esterification of teichoic acids